MATGFPYTVTNALLDGLCNSTAWTEPAAFWVKLHYSNAGNGSAAPATETARQQATFSAASGGSITTSADLVWTNVAATETYRYVSYWDASTGGNVLGVSRLDAEVPITAGQTFTIAAGNLTISLPVAS